MDSNLVKLTTQDVNKATIVTNSSIVANLIDYEHWQITRLIEKHIEDFSEFGLIDFESQLVKTRKAKTYNLNEQQFLLLVTYLRAVKKAPKVLELKKQMVRAFALMKSELQARQETRHIGIAIRKSLTDSIKNNVDDDTNFKRFAYSTYSKLIYKKILGKDVKKLKAERKVPQGKNIRDYLTIEELEKVQEAESKVAMYIEMRKNIADDKQIYEEIKEIL